MAALALLVSFWHGITPPSFALRSSFLLCQPRIVAGDADHRFEEHRIHRLRRVFHFVWTISGNRACKFAAAVLNDFIFHSVALSSCLVRYHLGPVGERRGTRVADMQGLVAGSWRPEQIPAEKRERGSVAGIHASEISECRATDKLGSAGNRPRA
jgi:hypothetical protein